jgi:hypothetical protein
MDWAKIMLAAQTNAIANHPARKVVFIAVWFKKLLVAVNVTFRPDSRDKKAKPAKSQAKTDDETSLLPHKAEWRDYLLKRGTGQK